MENIIQMLLTDSDYLLKICKTDYEEVTEYQLFVRCLSEQTVVENEMRRLRTKEDGTMNSSALQNPQDSAECHLTVIIVQAAHIRSSATQRFIKRLPPLLPQKMHLTERKAKDTCRVKNSAT